MFDQFNKYILPTYNRFPVEFVKAKGMKIWDDKGNEYLDFFPGWGVGNVGHCNSLVVDAVKKQCENIMHIANVYYSIPQGKLAELIIKNSFDGQVFFCNSGAEANEGAIKLARKKNEGTDKKEIITFYNSFHGRTLAAITATAQIKYQKGFEPLPAGFKYCELNNVRMLKDLVNENTAAIMLEPLQGEGGINIVDPKFMNLIRELCDEYNALLMLDEVQTGMGRTGKMFGYQNFDIVPDVITLAKALGGGMPIGALVVKRELNNILTPGTHASTFGGNAVACSAGVAVFEAIKKENMLENCNKMGKYFLGKLKKLKEKKSCIVDVRGLGLMIGVELNFSGAKIVDLCRAKSLLINCTHDNVLRLMPALNVTKEEINKAVSVLEEVI